MKTTLLICAAFIVGRIAIGVTIPPEHATFTDFFKDAAHLFIGGLATAAWIHKNKTLWILFWALIVVEVAVAVLSRIL